MIDTEPLSFIGHDDDVVVVERAGGCVPVEAFSGCSVLLEHESDSMMVDCRLLESGTWGLSVSMLSPLHSLPSWDVVVEPGSEVSPRLVVHAPVGVVVTPCG